MIFNILDNTTELWMTKYIIGEIFSSGRATLYKNPSDQTVSTYLNALTMMPIFTLVIGNHRDVNNLKDTRSFDFWYQNAYEWT